MRCELLLFLFLFRESFEAVPSHLLFLNHHQKVFQVSPRLSPKPANNDICQTQLTQFSQALSNGDDWAVRLADTWAKVPAGYMSGNLRHIGDFDRCVRFRNESIQGQHCWVTFTASPNSTLDEDRDDLSLKEFANFLRNNNLKSTNGFCLPASCSNEDVIQFLNQQILAKNDLIAEEAQCRSNDLPPLEPLDYFAIVFFTVIALLLIASTSYEIIAHHKEANTNKLFTSFSMYTNGAKLFDVTKIKSASSLNCLHGIRVMSLLWIMLGHRYYFGNAWGNPDDYEKFNEGVLGSIVWAHMYPVDTFFLIGALLMTYGIMRDCEKGNLNFGRVIWRRYLRYTPAFAVQILIIVCFGKYMLLGPQNIDYFRNNCLERWWMALLYIQNFIDDDLMCLNQGWYLCVDFQLFLISPFIVWSMHKYGKKLLTLPAACLLASTIYLIVISLVLDIRMFDRTWVLQTYLPTQSRAGPWFIGIILGYFMYIHRGKTFRINKWLNAGMWILSISITVVTILLHHGFLVRDWTSVTAHVTFIALQRSIWVVPLCWIIFACQNLKTGGIIRWFLSLPQWQPFSRMGLSIYIISYSYQLIEVSNRRSSIYFSEMISHFWSDIIVTIMMATASYLAFEVPPMLVDDYVYKKIQDRNAKKGEKKSEL